MMRLPQLGRYTVTADHWRGMVCRTRLIYQGDSATKAKSAAKEYRRRCVDSPRLWLMRDGERYAIGRGSQARLTWRYLSTTRKVS
jgi:hypothetical protein